jgi:hypothetical protein
MGGGRFFCFESFSEVVGLKISDQGDFWVDQKDKSISKGEKRRMEAEARGHRFSEASGSNNDGAKPSEECKAVVFQALYEWFKETPFTNLNRNYLALGEVILKTPFLEKNGTRTDGSLATPHGWRISLWMRCTTHSQFLTGTGNSRPYQ